MLYYNLQTKPTLKTPECSTTHNGGCVESKICLFCWCISKAYTWTWRPVTLPWESFLTIALSRWGYCCPKRIIYRVSRQTTGSTIRRLHCCVMLSSKEWSVLNVINSLEIAFKPLSSSRYIHSIYYYSLRLQSWIYCLLSSISNILSFSNLIRFKCKLEKSVQSHVSNGGYLCLLPRYKYDHFKQL